MFTILGWIAAVAIALAGVMKLARSKEQLKASGMDWVDSFTSGQIKAISALEVALSAWTIVALIGDNETNAGYGTAGLTLVMAGAVATHLRRKDPVGAMIPPAVLAALAAVSTYGSLT